jgi:hypothetical protein
MIETYRSKTLKISVMARDTTSTLRVVVAGMVTAFSPATSSPIVTNDKRLAAVARRSRLNHVQLFDLDESGHLMRIFASEKIAGLCSKMRKTECDN